MFYKDESGGTADVILQWDVGKTVFMQRILDYALHRQASGMHFVGVLYLY